MKRNLKLTAVSAFLISAAALISPLASADFISPKNDTTPAISAPVNIIAQGTVGAAVAHVTGANGNLIFELPPAVGSLALNDEILVTLTGGLAWSSTAPTLTPDCGGSTDCDVGGGSETAAGPLLGGTAGGTTATWRVVKQLAAGDTLTINSNSTIFDVTGLSGGATGDLTLAITAVVGGTPLTIASGTYGTDTGVGGLFQGTNVASATVTASTSEVQVDSNYTEFGGGTSQSNVLGANASVTVTDAVTTTSIPSADIPDDTLLFTIAGNFAGVDAVSATGVTGAVGTGTTPCGAPTTPVSNGFSIATANDFAYACWEGAVVPGAAATAVSFTDLDFEIDGTSVQQARAFTIQLDLLASTDWSAFTILNPTTVFTMTRNGSFFSTNSTGDLNTIKITDRSGALGTSGGEINIMAWDAAGTMVPQAAGTTYPNTVSNNGTTVIPGADVRAAFPGAVRFDFTVNSADIIVSNVKKNADGITNNQYAKGDGGGSI